MARMRRYHYTIYFPNNIGKMIREFIGQIYFINLTDHAMYEMKNDENTQVPHPTVEQMFNSSNKVVEVYENLTDNGERTNIIQKMLIKITNLHYDYDFIYVLSREGYIVTAWASHKSDMRKIKRKEFYYSPQLLTA